MKRLRVAILMGGPSSEHAVSLASGHAVLSALDRAQYEAIPIVISHEGSWQVHADAQAAFAEGRALSTLEGTGGEISWPGRLVPISAEQLSFAPRGSDLAVAFIAMHGRYGEDGTVQGLLEAAGIPYTGSGILASALAMDKHRTLLLARALGIRIPAYVCLRRGMYTEAAIKMHTEELGYPFVVKPNRSGSSVGVSIVSQVSELAAALATAFAEDAEILLQQYIKGRELNCGILGTGPHAQALPLDEAISKNAFYDYEAKYQPGLAEHRTPADVSAETAKELSEAALMLYEAVTCTGMARIDFFLATNGDVSGQIFFNEINTIPGLTPTSILPKEAAAAGITFPELVDRLIIDALERAHRTQNRSLFHGL